jgi:glucosamine--fructose-6-phosphate aminotransferase (isomerizing)
MCGIIGYIGARPVVPLLIQVLKTLEYRGYDSAGVAVVSEGSIARRRAKGKISVLEERLALSPLEGEYGIGHTRWATHGRPSEENAHPHLDCTGKLVVVHNGIIENYLDLKQKLQKKGHLFKTETDTEVIVHLIEEYFADRLEEAVLRAVKELEGAYAIVAMSAEEDRKIVAAKQGAPVVVGLGEGEYFVASDVNALLAHTKKVVYLDDGEMAVIGSEGVSFHDFSARELSKKSDHLTWNPLMIEKRGFKHFMLKEIFEQPQVVRDTLSGRTSLDTGRVHLSEMGLEEADLKKIQKGVVIACGTSYHAGLIGKTFIENLARVPVDVEFASEYRYKDRALDDRTLIIVISQSGETADSLAAMKAVSGQGALCLAVCNVAKSSIARASDGVLYTHAGPEIGVAATKTFTAQVGALALLAIYLAQIRGRLSEEDSVALLEDLQKIPHAMESILAGAKAVEETAVRFITFSHFLYLGRWVSYPVAMEGALKLKEISYIHAEAYAGGEMKHGPIALIDREMPTMVVIPKDRVYDKMLSNIAEVKSRSGHILAVAFEGDEGIRDRVDDVLTVPGVNPLFSPLVTTLPLQLFSYYIAAARGSDVDQPRNLAKSVTVE